MLGKCEGLVVEEEEETMMAPTGSEMVIKRMGRFLLPRAKSFDEVADPAVPALRNAVCDDKIPWPPKKVILEGWRMPQTKWSDWVETLKPNYEHVWKKAGIFNAVIASTYEIRRQPTIVFALLLYWSSETNTFAFPWLEATLTLEDVMVLGSFPVSGEPLKAKEALTGKDKEMLTKMVAERKSFNKLSSKKASHYEWIKHYTDRGRLESYDGLDHVAFLSLWLSRFVFPAHPGKTVSESMFPIAIRLSLGTKIALGPSVLGSIYRDMRVLKDYVLRMGVGEVSTAFTVWAPFQLVHVWALEHFVALRKEKSPHPLVPGEPRVSRWQGFDVKVDLMYVVSVLESAEEFQWRPYMPHLGDWRPPCFYKDVGNWISLSRDRDDEDYVFILTASELVGVDCIEQYLPHRVAMQLGFDQDLPGRVPRANANWELAWTAYDTNFSGVKNVYAPPRLFEADCTQRFLEWQRESWLDHSQSKEKFMEQVVEHFQQKKPMPPQKGKLTASANQSLSSAYNYHVEKQQPNNSSRKRGLSSIYDDDVNAEHQIGRLASNVNNRQSDMTSSSSFCFPKSAEDVERESIILRMRENGNKAARLRKEMELKAEIENIKAEIAHLEDDVMNSDSMDEFEFESLQLDGTVS